MASADILPIMEELNFNNNQTLQLENTINSNTIIKLSNISNISNKTEMSIYNITNENKENNVSSISSEKCSEHIDNGNEIEEEDKENQKQNINNISNSKSIIIENKNLKQNESNKNQKENENEKMEDFVEINLNEKSDENDKLIQKSNEFAQNDTSDNTLISSSCSIHEKMEEMSESSSIYIKKFEICAVSSSQPKNPRDPEVLPSICKEDCGEDAYFILDQPNYSTLGIADGVGGWTSLGVDPSLFAWDLMNCCKEESIVNDEDTWPDPQDVLVAGYNKVINKDEVEAGSSTACILTLDKTTGTVYSTNIGDSGFIVIRDNEIAYHTQELQHYFNAPYQLSILPESMRSDPSNIMDTPNDAIIDQCHIADGDIIVLGTDGLWDNIFHEEIIANLTPNIEKVRDIQNQIKKINSQQYDSSICSTTEMDINHQDNIIKTIENESNDINKKSIIIKEKRNENSTKNIDDNDDDDIMENNNNDISSKKIKLKISNETQNCNNNNDNDNSVSQMELNNFDNMITNNEIVENENENESESENKNENENEVSNSDSNNNSINNVCQENRSEKCESQNQNQNNENSDNNEIIDNQVISSMNNTLENKSKEELYDECKKLLKKMASNLTLDAKEMSRSFNRLSPFSKNARHNGKLHFGGKIDDITVVIVYVSLTDEIEMESSIISK